MHRNVQMSLEIYKVQTGNLFFRHLKNEKIANEYEKKHYNRLKTYFLIIQLSNLQQQ